VKIKKCCDVVIDDQNDVATATTIAAIWSAKWNELLAVNGYASISTATCRGVKRYAIYECSHFHTSLSLIFF
jgi:hypothetical protein